MKTFHCPACRTIVHFDNQRCLACEATLGYDPDGDRMCAPDAGGTWPDGLNACNQRDTGAACNWLLPAAAQDPQDGRCAACRLNQVIPDLGVPGNAERWGHIERAKRRVLRTLARQGWMPGPLETDSRGLAFRFLADAPGEKVLTGHADGVVTLNIAEADDAERERRRVGLGEPQRTLVGHLRHELSHYLQWRLVDPVPELIARCREAFGDDRADYAAALKRHYEQGAPADWVQQHISAYAASHPWEDWAETTAHLLLIIDALETASHWGLRLEGQPALPEQAQPPAELGERHAVDRQLVQQWMPLARFLNAMNRSIGVHDPYPFQLPDPVLAKLVLAHALLREGEDRPAAGGPTGMAPPAAMAQAPAAAAAQNTPTALPA